MLEEVIGRVIEYVSHRIDSASHDALHSINRAQIMATIDALAPPSTDQNILSIVRHPDHFMRYYLSDRKDKIEAALRDEAVHLRRPRVVQLSLRLFANKSCRNLAECLHFGSPVVHAKQSLWHLAKHVRDLIRLHGGMRADGGKHRLQAIPAELPDIFRQFTRVRLNTGHIRRHGQHTVTLAQFGQALREQVFQLLRRNIGINTSGGATEPHGSNSRMSGDHICPSE